MAKATSRQSGRDARLDNIRRFVVDTVLGRLELNVLTRLLIISLLLLDHIDITWTDNLLVPFMVHGTIWI